MAYMENKEEMREAINLRHYTLIAVIVLLVSLEIPSFSNVETF